MFTFLKEKKKKKLTCFIWKNTKYLSDKQGYVQYKDDWKDDEDDILRPMIYLPTWSNGYQEAEATTISKIVILFYFFNITAG